MPDDPPDNQRTNKIIRYLAIFFLGAVVVFAAAGIFTVLFVAPNQGNANGDPPTAVPASEIEPAAVPALDEKQSMLLQTDQLMAQAAEHQAPRDAPRPADLGVVTDPPIPTGIIEGNPGPFYSGDFLAENSWQTVEGEQLLQVFAGSDGQNSAQGMLVVLISPVSGQGFEESRYPTREALGPIRILAEEGRILFLETKDGVQLRFDLESRNYLP